MLESSEVSGVGTPLGCVLSVKSVPFPVLAEPGEVVWGQLWKPCLVVQGNPWRGKEVGAPSQEGGAGVKSSCEGPCSCKCREEEGLASSNQVSEHVASQLCLPPGPHLRPSTRSPVASAARMKHHRWGSNDRHLLSHSSRGWKH